MQTQKIMHINETMEHQKPIFLSFLSGYFLKKLWAMSSRIDILFYGFFYKHENRNELASSVNWT